MLWNNLLADQSCHSSLRQLIPTSSSSSSSSHHCCTGGVLIILCLSRTIFLLITIILCLLLITIRITTSMLFRPGRVAWWWPSSRLALVYLSIWFVLIISPQSSSLYSICRWRWCPAWPACPRGSNRLSRCRRSRSVLEFFGKYLFGHFFWLIFVLANIFVVHNLLAKFFLAINFWTILLLTATGSHGARGAC